MSWRSRAARRRSHSCSHCRRRRSCPAGPDRFPPLRALGEVGRWRGGPLAAELRAAAARAALGMPRATVLDDLAARCPVDRIAALVAALRRADRHGAPLGPSLRALAADARAQ